MFIGYRPMHSLNHVDQDKIHWPIFVSFRFLVSTFIVMIRKSLAKAGQLGVTVSSSEIVSE